MPFTLAHPAAVLLLGRTGLPMAALVAGAMSPDLPLFVPVLTGLGSDYGFTHSLLGVVTADWVVAVLAVLLWTGVVRDAVVDMAPAAVRDRLRPRVRYSRREWALAPPAAVIGALTHLLWDGFTHRGGWAVSHLAWLSHQHGELPGYKWAQYVSGALGLLVVLVHLLLTLRRLPRTTRRPRVPRLSPGGLPLVAVATTAGALSAAGLSASSGLHAMAYAGAVVGVLALVAGLTVMSVLWHALR